jgi:hypothetical protein
MYIRKERYYLWLVLRHLDAGFYLEETYILRYAGILVFEDDGFSVICFM